METREKKLWYHNFHEFLMEKMPTTHALRLTNEQFNCSSRYLLSWIMNPIPLQEIPPSLNRKIIKISFRGPVPSLSLDSRPWR